MNVLLTGASGFLGKIIQHEIEKERHTQTLGRQSSNTYTFDISKAGFKIEDQFDLVIHAAGKAHSVPKTEQEKQVFYEVNEKGTQNLLSSLIQLPGAFVFISTVAVYGKESGQKISEENLLNGNSPYALSKLNAEQLVIKWGKQNNIPTLILRLPLIAGINPPGNLGKMIQGIKTGKYLSINQGQARRSVVMAKDIAEVIKNNVGKNGIYNLTDGYHPSFRELESVICKQLNKSMPRSLPQWIATATGKIGDVLNFFPVNSDTINKMSADLTFDDSKARKELGWNPSKVIDHFQIR